MDFFGTIIPPEVSVIPALDGSSRAKICGWPTSTGQSGSPGLSGCGSLQSLCVCLVRELCTYLLGDFFHCGVAQSVEGQPEHWIFFHQRGSHVFQLRSDGADSQNDFFCPRQVVRHQRTGEFFPALQEYAFVAMFDDFNNLADNDRTEL